MFTSINPATGEPGESFAELTADEIEAKLVAAHAAYRAWRTTDLATRSALLEAIAAHGSMLCKKPGPRLLSGGLMVRDNPQMVVEA